MGQDGWADIGSDECDGVVSPPHVVGTCSTLGVKSDASHCPTCRPCWCTCGTRMRCTGRCPLCIAPRQASNPIEHCNCLSRDVAMFFWNAPGIYRLRTNFKSVPYFMSYVYPTPYLMSRTYQMSGARRRHTICRRQLVFPGAPTGQMVWSEKPLPANK